MKFVVCDGVIVPERSERFAVEVKLDTSLSYTSSAVIVTENDAPAVCGEPIAKNSKWSSDAGLIVNEEEVPESITVPRLFSVRTVIV